MRFELWLVVALALAPFQDPNQAKPPVKPFPLSDTAQSQALAEQIIGAWQLVRIDSPHVQLAQGDTVGYALFHDGYLSIEIHGQMPGDVVDSVAQFFESGVHRYGIDPSGNLQTSLLIGTTSLTDDGRVAFRVPGERRSFKMELVGENLTLTRPDATKFTLMKLGKLPFPGVQNVDAFGRPVDPNAQPVKITTDKKPLKKL